jgi:hypothetical protein
MSKNQLFGIILILIGVFDLFFLPRISQALWDKAQTNPLWAGAVNIVVRAIGVVFIFFGISYFFYGQLE